MCEACKQNLTTFIERLVARLNVTDTATFTIYSPVHPLNLK